MSVPGRSGLDRLIRAVVLLHRAHRLRHALDARREVRAVVARDHRRARRSLEVRFVEMLTAGDAVNVLMLVIGRRRRAGRGQGLTFALRELRLSLHPASKLQDPPPGWDKKH